MKRSIMLKWVKALESGKYRQIKGRLKDSVGNKKCGYCCLGVLCLVYAKETGNGKFNIARNDNPRRFSISDGSGHSVILPDKVRDWAGMKDSVGVLKNHIKKKYKDSSSNTAYSLTELNDTLDYNFKQIAKVIRKQYADL